MNVDKVKDILRVLMGISWIKAIVDTIFLILIVVITVFFTVKALDIFGYIKFLM